MWDSLRLAPIKVLTSNSSFVASPLQRNDQLVVVVQHNLSPLFIAQELYLRIQAIHMPSNSHQDTFDIVNETFSTAVITDLC